jgi:DNA primase
VTTDEVRDDVELTNLDQELFDGADATKRDLVDYLDAVRDRIIPQLRDRPLSVIRVLRGQGPFMQKNVPKYTPPWVRTVSYWAEKSKREVAYALCNDRRTLLWFANQRAIEYHVSLFRVTDDGVPTHLVMDIDPPEGSGFDTVVVAAQAVHEALDGAGLAGDERDGKVFLDSTRAGGATVVAAYSPRVRPGTPVSYPVAWNDLASVEPRDFSLRTVVDRLGGEDPWADLMPAPQSVPADLVAEGREIPIARVQAMHAGKRRARARRDAGGDA